MHATVDGRRGHFLTPPEPTPTTAIIAVADHRPRAAGAGGAARLLVVVAVWAAVAVGVGVRAHSFARNPSLWIDEAMLALNVIHRTPAELLEPLDLNQGAPIGYLLAVKLVVKWFGHSESSLRLLSLVAGLAGMLAFVPLAYRSLPVGAARLAVVLFALSPYLAGYCAEFKQYESDAAIAVFLLLIGQPVWTGAAGIGRVAALAGAGAAAVWFSHPAAFVLGGVGSGMLADAIARRDRAALLGRLLAVGCWALSFATCYLLFTRNLGMNQYLLDYWAGKFLPFPPTKPGDLAWLAMHFFEFFQKPGGLNADTWGLAGVAGLCYLIGAMALARSDWRLLVALTGPMGLCLAASALHKYPFAGRLMLFAVPGMILVVAYGAWRVMETVRGGLPGAGAILGCVLIGAGATECYWLVANKPLHDEHTREAVAEIRADWRDGDRLYVYFGAAPAFAYYTANRPFPAEGVAFGADNRNGPQDRYFDELRRFRGHSRVWVLIAHTQIADEAVIRAYLDGLGRREWQSRRPDAVVLRYDLSRSD